MPNPHDEDKIAGQRPRRDRQGVRGVPPQGVPAEWTAQGVPPLEWQPTVDVYEDNEQVTVHAELPGLKGGEIEISVNGDILRIKGERKREASADQGLYFRERRFGKFQRSVTLPGPVNFEKITTTYNDGLLKVVLPKADEAQPHAYFARWQGERVGELERFEGAKPKYEATATATLTVQGGEMAEARKLQEQVLEASVRVLGKEHPDTLRAMNNLAQTLYAQGEMARKFQEQNEQATAGRRNSPRRTSRVRVRRLRQAPEEARERILAMKTLKEIRDRMTNLGKGFDETDDEFARQLDERAADEPHYIRKFLRRPPAKREKARDIAVGNDLVKPPLVLASSKPMLAGAGSVLNLAGVMDEPIVGLIRPGVITDDEALELLPFYEDQAERILGQAEKLMQSSEEILLGRKRRESVPN